MRSDNNADVLHGFDAIGRHLGMTGEAARQRVRREKIPVVRSGRRVWIRRSTLNAWLAEREAEAARRAEGGRQ